MDIGIGHLILAKSCNRKGHRVLSDSNRKALNLEPQEVFLEEMETELILKI